jgi:Tol biopolymer transport system component
VLYEMLSGERAFKGETAADTMTAILTREPPDLDTTRLAISFGVDRIVRRCLEKTPDLRFQSATDLAFALETLSTPSTASAAGVDAAPLGRAAHRVAWLPWTVAIAALVSAAAIWVYKPAATDTEPPWQRFTPLTEAAGVETSPTLSPDGSTVAYAIHMNGSWDIYAQRVGGRNATAIVNDPKRDEGGPAYSPDGSLIAFHESDDDGGIFIAGATGESVRRVTDVGFDPAWSPDGKRIAFTTEEVRDPASRQTTSALYVVDAGGGPPRKLVEGDAIQASWSPSGERIVYWSNNGGQRDLFTVLAAGGAREPLTEDAAFDWSPVWSPDGRFVYFSSDRGGAMNLWRIAVEQSSGRARGVPMPVTAGVQASAALPRFSRDGTRLAFRSRVGSINPVAIPFDPATNRAGVPVVLDGSNNIRVPSDVSPDGTQIAYFSIGERQEDIFIGGVDGRARRVTDDPGRDRAPVFTRDGQSLVFYSNRDGTWGIWGIRTDGSNLRKIATIKSGSIYPVTSPLDETIVFSAGATGDGNYSVPFSGSRPPVILSGTKSATGYFLATSWSRDGARLCGPLVSESGRSTGVGVYDLRAHTTTPIAPDETFGARWLPDGRHVMYFTSNSRPELVVVDSVTRQRSVVSVQLPGPATNDVFSLSPDGRTIYYGAVHAEADIWIAERK